MSSVFFSGEADASRVSFGADGTAILPGKLFHAGAYPDKGFSMTTAEIAAEVARFNAAGEPAPMNVEHKKSVLDGALGHVRRLWQEGDALHAEFSVPRWLYDVARSKRTPLKVSAEFAVASKRLRGAAWVLNPRVTDAQLVAAFSAAASVTCIDYADPPGRNDRTKGNCIMPTLKERAAALLQERGAQDLTPDDITALFAEDASRLAALEADSKATAAERAAAFADRMITVEKRAFPCERPAIMALFTMAAAEDAERGGTIAFSVRDGEETKGSRLDVVRALFAARPAHGLDDEWLSPDLDAAALSAKFGQLTAKFAVPDTKTDPGSGADAAIDEKRREELLSLTPHGRAILADRKAAKGG